MISDVNPQELQQDQPAESPSQGIIGTDSKHDQFPKKSQSNQPESKEPPSEEPPSEELPSEEPPSIIRRLLAYLPCFKGNEEKKPFLRY